MAETAHERGLRLAREAMTPGRARYIATRIAHEIEMDHASSEWADAKFVEKAGRIGAMQQRATGVNFWEDSRAIKAAALRLLISSARSHAEADAVGGSVNIRNGCVVVRPFTFALDADVAKQAHTFTEGSSPNQAIKERHMDTMVKIQISAGTVIHVGGIPVQLCDETVVETASGNADLVYDELLARQAPRVSTGADEVEGTGV